MARTAQQAQKAAAKRKAREKRLREEKTRRQLQGPGSMSKRQLLQEAATLSLHECVISKGWQERGTAHILLVRQQPDDSLLVGGYFVDLLCLGLKDTAVVPNLQPEEYESRVKPEIFHDAVEFEDCPPQRARAVVEGAIEFAERFGFRPNKRWAESHHLFAGVETDATGLEFGRGGKPCLVKRPEENLVGAERRLQRTLAPADYIVEDELGENRES